MLFIKLVVEKYERSEFAPDRYYKNKIIFKKEK